MDSRAKRHQDKGDEQGEMFVQLDYADSSVEYGFEVGKRQAGPLIKKLLVVTVQGRLDGDAPEAKIARMRQRRLNREILGQNIHFHP